MQNQYSSFVQGNTNQSDQSIPENTHFYLIFPPFPSKCKIILKFFWLNLQFALFHLKKEGFHLDFDFENYSWFNQ